MRERSRPRHPYTAILMLLATLVSVQDSLGAAQSDSATSRRSSPPKVAISVYDSVRVIDHAVPFEALLRVLSLLHGEPWAERLRVERAQPGSSDRRVGEHQVLTVRDRYPDWSPDGDRIVFDSDRTGVQQIFLLNLENDGLVQLTSFDAPSRGPVFSPDGEWIAFQSERDGPPAIFVMRADGSEARNLTHPGGPTVSADGPLDGAHPKWAPDGRSIVFNGNVAEGNNEVFEIQLDGSELGRLTDHRGHDTYPSISPDGRRLLWRRIVPDEGGDGTEGNSEIFVANRDGSEPRNLTRHSSFDGYPAWLPSGEGILFASNRDGTSPRSFNLFVMRPDGARVTRITETMPGVAQVRPSISPDGRAVLFNRDFTLGDGSDGRTTLIFVQRFEEPLAKQIGSDR